jgi:hypothetical protein
VPHFETVEVDDETVTYSITKELVRSYSAAIVFEIDNHGDMSIINGLARSRLWIAANFDQTASLYDAMRRLIVVAEKIHFLG